MIFKDVTRGGQATLHNFRMFSQVTSTIISIAGFLFIAFVISCMYLKTPKYDWYIGQKFLEAHTSVMFGEDKIEIINRGQKVKVSIKDFLHSPGVSAWQNRIKYNLIKFSIIGFVLASILAACLIMLFRKQSKATLGKKHIRGSKLVTNQKLKKILTKNNKKQHSPCSLYLHDLEIPKNSETQHLMMYGAPGSGKTVAMNSILTQIREQNFKTIVYDIEGTYIPKFYRPGKDIILNPLDARTPSWNLWQETNISTDFDDIATAIIPKSAKGSDDFWNTAARNVFSSAAQNLQQEKTMQNLLHQLFTADQAAVERLLKGTMSQTLIEKDAERTAKSILLTLGTYCKNLQYVHDQGAYDSFSIKDWITSNDDSWLFLSTSEQYQASFAPIISMWLDIAISAFLSLPESRTRRTFFILDELASLGRQHRFRGFLERARKRGGCMIGALQDFNQLCEIYGNATAQSIQSQVGTTLYFRLNNPDSARKAALHLGQEEFIQANEGFSVGAHEMRDGVNVNNQTKKDFLVMPAEIMAQEARHAYLKLAGNLPVTQVEFPIKPIHDIEPALVARSFKQETKCNQEPVVVKDNLAVSEVII